MTNLKQIIYWYQESVCISNGLQLRKEFHCILQESFSVFSDLLMINDWLTSDVLKKGCHELILCSLHQMLQLLTVFDTFKRKPLTSLMRGNVEPSAPLLLITTIDP